MDLLEQVDEATTCLGGEKYSTMSWLLPLVFGLRQSCTVEEDDCPGLAEIKRQLGNSWMNDSVSALWTIPEPLFWLLH